ncbi:ABC transporter ATP-binding protein/permease [bacterium]|nr:ABC transporter ATP-binding protein/permease [bacterium]
MQDFKKLLYFLDSREKSRAFLLVFLIFIGAFLETVSIGLFFPFVALVNDPAMIESSQKLNALYKFSRVSSPSSFLIFLGLGMVGVILFKGLYLGFLSEIQARFLVNRQLSFERRILGAYLRSPYLFFLNNSPVELTRKVRTAQSVIISVVMPLLLVLSEISVLTVVMVMLFVVQPWLTLGSIAFLGSLTAGLYFLVRRRTREIGEQQAFHDKQLAKWLEQTFSGIKEIKVLGCENFFSESVLRHSDGFCHASRVSYTISQFPRLFLETLATAGLTLYVLSVLLSGRDPRTIIPSLALFAVAAFRLMPSFNRIVNGLIAARQYIPRINDVYNDMQTLEGARLTGQSAFVKEPRRKSPWTISKGIEYQNVTHRYPGERGTSLEGLSLSILCGQSVAFVGQSGAGKSTAVDALLGLLPIEQGKILVDGMNIAECLEDWQSQIGYIPQTIYLSDDTIRKNIAFGVRDQEVSEEQIWRALKDAQLDEFVRSLPNGLETEVGDRGVRLSGGQRQRIGIARALYFDPKVLVLDEATSALDNDTEKAVIHAIERLRGKKTIIVIAHRLSTVARCDQLYFFQKGRLITQGTYQDLVAQHADFRRFAAV